MTLLKNTLFNNTTKVWKKKQERSSQEECDLAMHAQDKESYWYIDNGCSRHMTGDENKFLKLKREKGGNVSFGDNKSAKIIGKGKVSLGSQKATTENVLLVEDLKHDLLSVSQLCDQGHTLLFNSQECRIRKEDTGKLVATTIKTPNNVYILNKIGKEVCCVGQTDESWLWNKRMGHLSFENLVKVSNHQEVRGMPKIIKPSNPICKHCQHGKQTRVRFRTKEYSTSRPLELIHTDLLWANQITKSAR
jgi:RNase P subunit RPR2